MYLNTYLVILCCAVLESAIGHGRMNQPPGRATMWRYGFQTPADYNDHQVYCGGLQNLWNVNKGKCGVCGDPYQQTQPRDHEAGGKYGKGIIVRRYNQGQIITVKIEITANHQGYFEFSICATNHAKMIATENCMQRLRLANGQLTYQLLQDEKHLSIDVQLPASLTCSICVFRWKYVAAQNVGFGERQEHFYSCADVAISSGSPSLITSTPSTKRPTSTRSTTTRSTTTRPTTTRRPFPHVTSKPTPPIVCPPTCKYYCSNFKICNLSYCSSCLF